MVLLCRPSEVTVVESAVVAVAGVVVVVVAVEVAEVEVEPGLEAVVNCQYAPQLLLARPGNPRHRQNRHPSFKFQCAECYCW